MDSLAIELINLLIKVSLGVFIFDLVELGEVGLGAKGARAIEGGGLDGVYKRYILWHFIQIQLVHVLCGVYFEYDFAQRIVNLVHRGDFGF